MFIKKANFKKYFLLILLNTIYERKEIVLVY
jgi:hypothetical protein